jgi:hypothetical protein
MALSADDVIDLLGHDNEVARRGGPRLWLEGGRGERAGGGGGQKGTEADH